jgi:hypothetical protein
MTLIERQREYTSWLEKGFPELDLAGLSLIGACAVTGNASQENLVKPVTTGTKDHGSDGVLQWRLDRLDGPRGLKGWSAALGLPWDTLKTQAAFTLWELSNDPRYFTLLKDLRDGKKKIETLVANFCWVYERPNKALAHLDKRISHAKSVYLILSKERKVPLPNKIGAGTAVVVGGAATANAATGGDLLWTVIGGVAALAASIAGPVISQWGKTLEKPPTDAPAPSPKPSPAPIATPSPDLIAVASRIEARQIEMLEMLKALAADVAALKSSVEQIKTSNANLRAALVAKEEELAAARDTMTPEQQAVFDGLKAEISATMQIATAAA